MMMAPAITPINEDCLFVWGKGVGGGGGAFNFLTCIEFIYVFEFQLKEMKKNFKYYY
jgi:hypothetical protein